MPAIPWYRWRPVWWRRFLWYHTGSFSTQQQATRQILGGRWVLVMEETDNHWWYPLSSPLLPHLASWEDDKWGDPIQIEDWR